MTTARRHAWRPRQRHNKGFVLIALVALLTIGGLYFFITNLSPEVIEARRQEKTTAALVQAREALIGYALQYREQQRVTDPSAMYGHLPLPDFGESVNLNGNLLNQSCTTEGCAKINAAGVSGSTVIVGRFPWKTLGTEPLRDGHAECLWYAISATHRAVNSTATTMNWDTLAVPDVVIGSGLASLAAVNAHERPLAVIFSAGAAFDGGRTASTDARECGGNYDVTHYVNAALNNAQRSLPMTSAMLFDTLRKSTVRAPLDPPSRPPSFRDDINDMIEGMVPCARDQIVAGSIAANAKVNNACSSTLETLGLGPRGYYNHYRDQVFVAKCSGCQVTVDTVFAPSCAGALLFGNQRSSGQNRRDVAEMGDPSNYLEGDNLASFNSAGNLYAGFSKLLRASTVPPVMPLGQDIVHCIPSGASMVTAPSALPAAAELSQYDAASRTITLGRVNIESDQGYGASSLFGCTWQPEAHATGSGFRKYFWFQITDAGDGFAFAAVDGDRNTSSVCGAGEQHLGYSGNNGFTTPIAYPKLGLEVDTRRNYQTNAAFTPTGFNPARRTTTGPLAFRTLANGRADPNYTGGHIGLVYWGGEAPISTSDGVSNTCTVNANCLSPAFCDAGVCKLNQEEDDNVHGQLPTAPASRPPPLNPVAPVTPPGDPPYPPYAVDKLDPSLSQVPPTPIHMRIEVTRTYTGRDDNSRLVRVVSTANLATLSGLPNIDGITLLDGDTLLVAGQTNASANGVYVAAVGTWTRATSADEAFELAPGTSWFIKEGSTYKGSLWRLQNQEVPILGFSFLDIQHFRSPVKTVATTNIALAGLSAVGGYTPLAGDRILLAGQTDPKENGVWVAVAGAWSRSSPENAPLGMKDGAMWFVSDGTSAGTYWRLNGDATPGTSNINIAQAATNDLYAANVTTEVWKEGSNVGQIARMKDTTRSMFQLDPVVRHGTCALTVPLCPTVNPADQYCGGTESDGLRYCYTGQQPKLYDRQKIYDIRGTTSCGSNASCTGNNQFCGIDNVCYQPALRTTRLGFTTSQSTQSQVITIDNNFDPKWLP